jgi:hypothetical protein
MHTKFDIYVLIADIYLEFDNNSHLCLITTNNQQLWLAVWSQCNTYISNYFHELDEKFCKI